MINEVQSLRVLKELRKTIIFLEDMMGNTRLFISDERFDRIEKEVNYLSQFLKTIQKE